MLLHQAPVLFLLSPPSLPPSLSLSILVSFAATRTIWLPQFRAPFWITHHVASRPHSIDNIETPVRLVDCAYNAPPHPPIILLLFPSEVVLASITIYLWHLVVRPLFSNSICRPVTRSVALLLSAFLYLSLIHNSVYFMLFYASVKRRKTRGQAFTGSSSSSSSSPCHWNRHSGNLLAPPMLRNPRRGQPRLQTANSTSVATAATCGAVDALSTT